MNNEILKQAIESLAIHDVRLDNSYIKVKDDFEPLFPESETINVQYKSGISNSVIGTATDNESGKEEQYLRAKYQCGFRVLVPPHKGATPPKGVDLEGWEQVAEVVADFIAYYLMKSDINNEAIEEFSKYNVGYHIWPYWREYASSVATRLRLPPVIPPLYVLPKDK
ncbi:MAG: hypothetical protein KME37_10865 [Candidatus Thiodiazotropha sp. (ex Codakia orbicularis)]|nr:hypothetical protein [Candidatus Thiodiazotropha sp. (ex Codakia orbicularis)]